MDEYKYTIIIPHYRDFDSLSELLRTIPERNDIQVIIIDDNSYSDSGEAASKISAINGNNLILKFNHPNRRGAGGCRNIGLDIARGQWIICADADDYFTEDAFETFDKMIDSEADIVYFGMTSVNLPDMTTGDRHLQYENLVKRYLKKQSKRNELNLRYNFPSPCAKMVRRAMVEKYQIRFDDIRWSNDDMFATKCGFYARSIDALDETVYCATRKNGTITTTRSEESFRTRFDTYVRKMSFLQERLTKKDFKMITRWPGNKLLLAKLEGYDRGMLQYILQEYKKYNISLGWINLSDLNELGLKIKSYFKDKKYR